MGVCLGFLPFNWHPSKIIMGDAGALFLGVLLAVPTITIGGRTDLAFSGNTFFFFGPLLIPVVILGVPILDTVFSFVRRLVERQRWHQADAGHLHHRLMRLGHGPRRTVVILWAWTALLSGVALVPTYTQARATRSCRSSSPRSRCSCSRGSTPGSAAPGAATSGPATRPAQPPTRTSSTSTHAAANGREARAAPIRPRT